MIKYIPNILTFFRILLVPIIVVLVKEDEFLWSLMIFVLAGVSDGLDGYIAKRYHCQSRLGALIDPLADKLLILCLFVMLTIKGNIPFWFFIMTVFRDFIILSGYAVLKSLHETVKLSPIISSKINTCLQILYIIDVLAQAANIYFLPTLQSLLMYSTVFFILLSGFQYVWVWTLKHMNDEI